MEKGKNTVVLSASAITKDFPGTRALNGVSLDLREGEIHALIGENGAGKSTLLKILSGIIQPDQGEVKIDGKNVKIPNPRTAYNLGIGLVSQELNLISTLSVEKNLFLAREPLKKGFLIDQKKISAMRDYDFFRKFELNISPDTLVEHLSVPQRQLVTIARALIFNPRILLVDEPTASLSVTEIERLFLVLRELKTRGISMVYVSHRLEEIFQLADKVTVLRDGNVIDTKALNELSIDSVISMMVGREISDMYSKTRIPIGEEALRITGLTKKDVCEDISITVRKGEVVGLYGLVGAGRTEMARLVFGLESFDQGEITLFGKKMKHLSPAHSIMNGLGYLTEDRNFEGLCMNQSIKRNITRASMRKMFPRGCIDKKREEATARQFSEKLRIKTPSLNRDALFLSGGNRQKVVFAHWLCAGSRVLILDEPTRGIDVGAKAEIYKIINELLQEGNSILFISSDLPEIIGISDRIYVMYKGKIHGCFDKREEFSSEQIVSCGIGR